jgi:polysaccharide export outer membrane protein
MKDTLCATQWGLKSPGDFRSFVLYRKEHSMSSALFLSSRSSVRIILAVFTILAFTSYCSEAQETSHANADIAEVVKKEGGAISPEQLSKVLSARSAEQQAQQPVEQPEKPETSTVQDQGKQKESEKPSAIELLLSGQAPGVVSTNLTQFGYGVFRGPVSTFAPIENVPVGPDYVVGPGDNFTVTLWGRMNAQYPVTLNRNGEIVLPEVGVLNVSGMTLVRLENYLYDQFSRKYTDFKMALTMGRLRTIVVYVVGEAMTPGSYTLSSLSTVMNALFAAGGPSKNGTLRNIRLLRNGREPVTIDLYKFLLGGDKSDDVRLANGDTIYIPLIGPVVGVAGNVKRPAIYEMTKPMTLTEVLDLAGGVTYAGWLQRVQVERVDNHKRRIVADFNVSERADVIKDQQAIGTIVQDGDVIKVFPVTGLEQNVVHLEGHVVRPGKYEFVPGMRLGDILKSYDTLQPEPDLEYGEVERLAEPDFHRIIIPFNVGKLLNGDKSENIELARFDTIRVFRWDERVKKSVSVSGLVFRPGNYRLIPGMTVSDLIDDAGGLMKDAYLKKAEISRRHVSQSGIDTEESGVQTEEIAIDLEKAFAGVPEHNIALQDGDSLVVRPIDERIKRNVSISGLVFAPGEYPLIMDMKVSDLIDAAGGLMKNAYLKTAELTRRHISQSGMQTEKIDIDLEQALAGVPEHDIALQDYDHLIVRPIPELEFDRTATVSGEVMFPGTYPTRRGETLSSLIERAGGYTERAYLKGAVFTRESAKTIQQRRMDELISQVEETVLIDMDRAIGGALDDETVKTRQASLQAKKEILSKIRTAKIDGRVVIRLTSLDSFKGSQYDLELEKADQLMIPETPGVVNIVGEVFNPTAILYQKDKTVEYYLRRVGGLTNEAEKKQLSIIRADGSVISIAQRHPGRVSWDSESNQWFFGGFMNIKLDPGDTIVVPRKMDRFFWIKFTKDITQIVFQTAVAAGVVLAL